MGLFLLIFFTLFLLIPAIIYVRSPVQNLKKIWSYIPIHSSTPRESGLESKLHLKVEEIPALILCAILLAEDENFFRHRGFSFRSIWFAFKEGLRNKKFLKGGSTISQQVIKNFFLYPKRSWIRKLIEAIYTIKLERTFSKYEILSFYVSHMEWAVNVYGLSEATQFYFQKDLSSLGIGEAAFLGAILSKPAEYEKEFKNDRKLSQELMKRMGRLIMTMLYLFPEAPARSQAGCSSIENRFLYEEFLSEYLNASVDTRKLHHAEGKRLGREFTATYLGHTHSIDAEA